MILVLLFIVACFLAFSNGANDNFKSVATLFGSKTIHYRGAINWSTITTFTGSIAAIFFAETLVHNFSGKGLIPNELIQAPEFSVSIALGAGTTVFLASRVGMPVSTTHSLVGALLGSGIIVVGSSFNFSKLVSTFLIPLIISPLMAATLSLLTYLFFRKIRLALGVTKKICVLAGGKYQPLAEFEPKKNLPSIDATHKKTIKTAEEPDSVQVYQGQFIGISFQKLINYGHFLSAGVVSFARGLNDTPKIVGLLLVIQSLEIKWGMLAIAVAIAIGGLVHSKKVGEVVANKITPMNNGQGFTANLITGLLVTTANVHGMPVSTTHISVGSIFGIGTVSKKANVKMIKNILWSWFLTLPSAAIFSAIFYGILQQLS
ncbi:inorganic phosphate transporter [Xanthovirga aplysinae]|uniref:inorganic phosphate transporter n=1 Tax=Xanthovirga aplysinae TaxID=2529853 RepID=UPI0012BC0EF9|nr:inorganic phosphate transporter [Xanthovirga aplysinae]MTI32553.1 inorganic phosphate transporter [Xanthovirga aplysinae]